MGELPPYTRSHDDEARSRAGAEQTLTDRRRWLCIAYAFAPINRSGTHRTLGFVKHLDRLGWDATVVTVEPGTEPVDDTLLAQVPSTTIVVRTIWAQPVQRLKRFMGLHTAPSPEEARDHSRRVRRFHRKRRHRRRGLREWISRFLMTPDSRIGWIAPAVSAAMKSIRKSRPDVIYSTSPYMSAHLIAMIVAYRTAIPWVADFRDPWRDNPFRKLGFKSLDRWDAWLERLVLRRATHVVCNTPTYERRLHDRFPMLASKCSTILNGFDADIVGGLEPKWIAPRGEFVFTHCGQFYGSRSPLPWLWALRCLRNDAAIPARKPHLFLIGPDHFEGRPLVDLARSAGVGDCVHVLGRMPHRQALSYLAGSDALLLAGSVGTGSDLQVPGKLFEYLALRKPILAGVAPTSPVVGILQKAGAVARICAPNNIDAISDAMRTMTSERHHDGNGSWNGVERFDRARRAEELAALFERLVRGGGEPFGQVLRTVTANRRQTITEPLAETHAAPWRKRGHSTFP